MTRSPFPDEGRYPFARHLGLRMTHWEADLARFEMPLADFLMNRHDNPHGGAHAASLDTAMGYAGCWTGDPDRQQMCLTLSLTVHYLSRPKGRLLLGEGRRTGGGRSTFFAEGSVTDETGERIASATGVFRYRA